MTTGRRTILLLTVIAIALITSAVPGSAQRPRTTSTTASPAPGEPPGLPAGTVVNSWALAPAGSDDPAQPGERPDFSYSVTPGQEIVDQATLYNFSNVPLTFRVYATDATNNAEGEFDPLPAAQKPTGVGSWVALPQETISLPAKKQATFPITIRVPAQARPGDHAGAILASSAVEGFGPDGKVVNVDRRTGSRIYLRVAGPVDPELAIEAVRTTYDPALNPLSGATTVRYTIRNDGNVRLAGRHRVTVSGPLGIGSRSSAAKELPELLPREEVTFRETVQGTPAAGLAFARVTLEPARAAGTGGSLSRRAAALALPLTFIAVLLSVVFVRYARHSYVRRTAGS